MAQARQHDVELFVPFDISKMGTDDECIVHGYATTPARDSQGEIVSREAIENALDSYMQYATVREMHRNDSAVGVAESAELDSKGLLISARIVDPIAVAKVRSRVYRGFSIGGKSIIKKDGIIRRMTLQEISLVDKPSCPDSYFSVYKSDDDFNPEQEEEDTMSRNESALQFIRKMISNRSGAQSILKVYKDSDERIEETQVEQVGRHTDSFRRVDDAKPEFSSVLDAVLKTPRTGNVR